MDQITDDILYEPKCNICIEVYGFIELYEQNEFIIELYSSLNSQFVFDMSLAAYILGSINEDDIKLEGGIINIIRKLSLITDTIKKAKEEKGDE